MPIEPDEQTALCDGTMELPGVIACGVPGAGGYDAVFALCIGDEAVSKVAAYWEGYQRVSVCPLLGQIEWGGDKVRESSEIEERWVYPMPFYVVKLLSEVAFLKF